MTRGRVALPRHGTVIVGALVLVLLAGGLLALAAVSARRGARAVILERAALLAETGVRRALAEALRTWGPDDDALAIGAVRERSMPSEESGMASYPVRRRVSVRRITGTLFAIAADVRIGPDPCLARRRASLVVERPTPADSGSPSTRPVPLGRWSIADLY